MIADIEELKGVKIPREISTREELSCDICNEKINSSHNKIGIYTSDVDISKKERTDMNVDVVFCQECNPEKIRHPHLGINEINFTVFIESYNDSILVERAKTNHTSTDEEGKIWTPLRLWDRMTETKDEPTSASYVTEKLRYENVPLDDVIEKDGKLDINYIMEEIYNQI